MTAPKYVKYLPLTVLAAALGACGFLGSDGFEFKQIDDKITGTRMIATKQFSNESKTLIAEVSLNCIQNNKQLSLDLKSFNSPAKSGDTNLTGSALQVKGSPPATFLVGKVKFGANEAIDLDNLYSLAVSSFNNVASWNIGSERLSVDFANLFLELRKVSGERNGLIKANPELVDYPKLVKSIEENKAKLIAFEAEQKDKAAKATEDFEKESHLAKVKAFQGDLHIEEDEKKLAELKGKSGPVLTKLAELELKLKDSDPRLIAAFKKVIERNPEISKALEEAKANGTDGIALAAGLGGAIAGISSASAERTKVLSLFSGSVSDADLFKKLGTPIAFNLKTANGEITFAIDTADKSIMKVVSACQ